MNMKKIDKPKRMIPPPIPPKHLEDGAPPVDAVARAQTKIKEAKVKTGKSTSNTQPTKETGGPQGLEPTRYGDWERAGRCFDF